jgi:hypothetical protein
MFHLEQAHMSENFLRLIPTDPGYVPPLTLRQQAREVFSSFLPHAAEIVVSVTAQVEWIDQGANVERVLCPICQKDLDLEWWRQAMDRSYQTTHFADLMIEVPCCCTVHSLNDLQYEWPAGFARFVLEARDPSIDLEAHQIHLLEQIVQSPLRKVWAHL